MTLPAPQFLTALVVLVAITTILVACSGIGQHPSEPTIGVSEEDYCAVGECLPATVDRVIDGDTVDVTTQAGEHRRVRVLGIDTPETVHPDRPVECLGPEASATTSTLLPAGARITLVSDAAADPQDTYGRYLAHILIGDVNVGNELISQGLASTTTFPHSLAGKYADSQEIAQRNSAGIWGQC